MNTIIGIDMGGTKIEGNLFDKDYKILQTHRVPTEAQTDTKTILQNIFTVIETLKKENTTGIGVSCAGMINEDGKILQSPNIKPLDGVNLKNEINKKFSLETHIENDAKCFALAEAMLGAGKKKKICIGIIIGTGVGCGIIIEHKIYHGTTSSAGELGHIIRAPGMGEFETFFAGPGIEKRYHEITGKELKSEEIMDEKDSESKLLMEETYSEIGRFISIIVLAYNPDVIVIGGGVSKSLDYKKLQKTTETFLPKSLHDTFAIKKHSISDAAGSIGAALLIPNTD